VSTLPPSVLGMHPLLRGLAGPHLTRLAGHGQAVTLPDRHRLFEEGQPASRFWLIEAGQTLSGHRSAQWPSFTFVLRA
jgi:CRP-like cAMP-binding protein